MLIEVVKKCADKAGGPVKLAAALGIKHTSFHDWKQVPPERVLELERLTGVSKHEIRPDIYPPPSEGEQPS